MRIELTDVTKGEGNEALESTTLVFESNAVTLAAVETAQRPTLLALIASGRMRPDTGSVTAYPEMDDDELRASVAVVDAPDISAPAEGLRLDGIVQEELMFAGAPSSLRAAVETLDRFGARDYADWSIENVPVVSRLRVLADLAARRPDVTALVLTSPDRYGGHPVDWYPVAEELAQQGYAVLVIAGAASIALLDAELAELAGEAEPEAIEEPTPRPTITHENSEEDNE